MLQSVLSQPVYTLALLVWAVQMRSRHSFRRCCSSCRKKPKWTRSSRHGNLKSVYLVTMNTVGNVGVFSSHL